MSRPKIGFVFTNYNNSALSLQALHSIFNNCANFECYVVIVDNNSTEEEKLILKDAPSISSNISVIFNEDNIGYFPGLNVCINALRFDHNAALSCIVIGNNDLVFPGDFFQHLHAELFSISKYSVISPDLVTLDGIHQNPHVITNISRFREIVWDIYFINYIFSKIILKSARLLASISARKDHLHHRQPGFIHQGYGACYILTHSFFEHFDSLWCPGFLMGEEFYLAKQLDVIGQKTYYNPRLLVLHHDHATVSKISNKLLWDYSKEAHKIYRRYVNPYYLNMNINSTMVELDSCIDQITHSRPSSNTMPSTFNIR